MFVHAVAQGRGRNWSIPARATRAHPFVGARLCLRSNSGAVEAAPQVLQCSGQFSIATGFAVPRLLETRMRELRGSNRMAAVDRVAVLAALNMAHEMQQSRDGEAGRDAELASALDDLRRRLDNAGV